MARTQRLQEMEFELALLGVLEDVHDLAVRADGDSLDRRQRGFITLHFDYHYDRQKSDDVKVVVAIDGTEGSSFAFPVNFSDVEAIHQAAEDCEALALAITALAPERNDDFDFGRRWE